MPEWQNWWVQCAHLPHGMLDVGVESRYSWWSEPNGDTGFDCDSRYSSLYIDNPSPFHSLSIEDCVRMEGYWPRLESYSPWRIECFVTRAWGKCCVGCGRFEMERMKRAGWLGNPDQRTQKREKRETWQRRVIKGKLRSGCDPTGTDGRKKCSSVGSPAWWLPKRILSDTSFSHYEINLKYSLSIINACDSSDMYMLQVNFLFWLLTCLRLVYTFEWHHKFCPT